MALFTDHPAALTRTSDSFEAA